MAQLSRRTAIRGCQHHHPAARAHDVLVAGTHTQAQGPGGDAGDLARGPAVQARDTWRAISTPLISVAACTGSTLPRSAISESPRTSFRSAKPPCWQGLFALPSALAPHRNLRAGARTRRGRARRHGGQRCHLARTGRCRRPPTGRAPCAARNSCRNQLFCRHDQWRGADDWSERAQPICRLTTTIDLKLQALAESVVAKRLAAEGKARKVSQAALIALAPDGAFSQWSEARITTTASSTGRSRPGGSPARCSSCSSISPRFEKGFHRPEHS